MQPQKTKRNPNSAVKVFMELVFMTELQTAGKHVSCWCGEVAYLENMK